MILTKYLTLLAVGLSCLLTTAFANDESSPALTSPGTTPSAPQFAEKPPKIPERKGQHSVFAEIKTKAQTALDKIEAKKMNLDEAVVAMELAVKNGNTQAALKLLRKFGPEGSSGYDYMYKVAQNSIGKDYKISGHTFQKMYLFTTIKETDQNALNILDASADKMQQAINDGDAQAAWELLRKFGPSGTEGYKFMYRVARNSFGEDDKESGHTFDQMVLFTYIEQRDELAPQKIRSVPLEEDNAVYAMKLAIRNEYPKVGRALMKRYNRAFMKAAAMEAINSAGEDLRGRFTKTFETMKLSRGWIRIPLLSFRLRVMNPLIQYRRQHDPYSRLQ